jgi:glycosyltransferase involved in cell wall biosynthesis
LSSRYEGFGLVILESLRSQVSLLCSKSEAAQEILGEKYEGLFGVSDSKSLAQLMDKMRDEKFRLLLEVQASDVLPKYSIRNTVESHTRIYYRANSQKRLDGVSN